MYFVLSRREAKYKNGLRTRYISMSGLSEFDFLTKVLDFLTKIYRILIKSLILAQDERWRRA